MGDRGDTVVVRYGIRHVPTPEREASLAAMRVELRGSEVDVFVDNDRLGPWNSWMALTMRLALESDAMHFVLLDDDLKLCPEFTTVVERLIDQRPNDVMGLYANTTSALAAEGGWLVSKALWACALIWPRKLFFDFCIWQGANLDQAKAGRHDDVRVAYWLKHTKRDIYMPVPSLVDHVSEYSLYHDRRVTNQRATLFNSDPEVRYSGPEVRYYHSQTGRFPGWLCSR